MERAALSINIRFYKLTLSVEGTPEGDMTVPEQIPYFIGPSLQMLNIFFFSRNKENVSEINTELFFVFRLNAVTPPQNSTQNPTIFYIKHVNVLNIQHNLTFNYNTKL